jgi:hypothetical protein
MVEMAKLDDDRQVATTVLDSLKELLDEIKEPVLSCIERPEILVAVIKEVFQQKVSATASYQKGLLYYVLKNVLSAVVL